MAAIRKLLIANRGEIAVRIISSAREMGIRTVAVASEADLDARHARLADECVNIGPPEPSASYLDQSKIIAAAKSVGADAIHPGYGFLSERAEFSEACWLAGIVFVGPPADAMKALGSKIYAKRLATEAKVPIAPGFFEPGADRKALSKAAAKIGYPIVLKASAGGGGRGMRVVLDPADFDAEFRIASDEALHAFGDGAMMVEKLIARPRHIEVQVLADEHGQTACLFERECSLQRRHQKLAEESPSPIGPAIDELWPKLREASLALVQASGYVGAGTVEFMVDPVTGEHYFLEVNARLQVEHPVTEVVTGLDLVRWQLRIAQGERLQLSDAFMAGDRNEMVGHAIEARIVAEDPAANFMPSVGRIAAWAEPKAPGIRVDTGYGPGAEVTRYYDSLLAKVIAHAETRDAAIAKLEAALMDFHVLGMATNIGYLLDVLRHPDFRSGEIDTGFLGREFADWSVPTAPPELMRIAELAGSAKTANPGAAQASGAWDIADGFRNSG